MAKFGDWTCELDSGVVTWSPQVFELLGRDPALGPPSLAEVAELPLEGPKPMAAAFEMAQNTGEPQYFEASTRLAGDKVVTSGQLRVVPDGKVQIKKEVLVNNTLSVVDQPTDGERKISP